MDRDEALDVLGLRRHADPAAVRRAYLQLARELHPDVGGDARAFHRVRTAYEVVGDDPGVAPRPQQRVAGVEERWWDGAGAWHDEPVDRVGIDLDRAPGDGAAVRMDLDLLASCLHGAEPVTPVRLRSRAPGSLLHRMIAWLQPDLLASVLVAPADDGPRAGHDVAVHVRCGAGRGRRLLAAAGTPPGWVRARGTETVRLERRLRPCRDPADTAVRVAREVDTALSALGWPLSEWFWLRR